MAQQEPGLVVAVKTAGKMGGRAVLSFLDLAGPDSMTREQIHGVLREYRAALRDGLRAPYRSDAAGAELYVGASIDFAERLVEFDALSEVLSGLVRFAVSAVEPRRGLSILESHEGERLVMRWDDASRDRIRKEVPGWLVPTFNIDFATRRDFEDTFGSIYPVALDALFPFGRDRIRDFGGAAIIDAATGETIWVTEESYDAPRAVTPTQ